MRTLILLLAMLWALGVQAATYYADFVSGSDSNSGTSGSPFKHCPGDSNATGTAASTTLTAGDTVIFKGGVTYDVGSNHAISLSWSGGSGNPITYDGNTAGTFGGGRAIISNNHGTGGNSAAAFAASTGSTRSNINVRGFWIKEIGGSASLPTDPGSAISANKGGGVYFVSGTYHDISVEDCVFEELGYYWHDKPMADSSIDGNGCFFSGTLYNITVTNCVFSKMHTCIGYYYSGTLNTNFTVAGCEMFDSFVWGVDIAPTAANASVDWVTIRNNAIHDYWQLDQGTWTGYGEFPHTDGIFFRSDFSGITYGTNNNFFGNHFYSTNGTGFGTADLYITEGPSANVYNNTFARSKKGRIVYINNSFNPSNPQVINIFNNSFITTYNAAVDIEGPGYNGLTMLVKNNIFYDTQTGSGNNFCVYISTTNALAGVQFDYNTYKSFNTGGKYFYYNGGEHDVASLRVSTKHWETNGIGSDPVYVSLGSASDPLSGDLTLQASSPCINAGVSLAAYFNTDKNGTTRPQGGNWEIGAYEYTGADTTPPTVSTVTISSDGVTWTLACSETVSVGSGGNGGFTTSMSGGSVTLTYSSGSGSSSLVYTGSRTVGVGETGTLSYTQPGNGIEDSAGNDLATFAGKAVSNNSTQGTGPANSARVLPLRNVRLRP